MYCYKCGQEIEDDSKFCPLCGAQIEQSQEDIDYSSYAPDYNNPMDKPSIGLNILSFLFPIIGIVLFFVWRNTYPIKGKSCVKFSLMSIIFNFIFMIVAGMSLGVYFINL